MIAREKIDLRLKLKSIAVSNKEKKDRLIVGHLDEMLKNYDTLLSYSPIKGEVDIDKINRSFTKEKTLYLPRVEGSEILFYKVYDFNNLTTGSFGIKEPKPIEKLIGTLNTLCIVPALAYTKCGKRLGRGGGYYDRFLESFKGVKIGICYSDYLLSKIPTESFDIDVDAVICDFGVFHKR